MSDIECDISEWTDFDKDLLTFIEETMPIETKKFMRREGGKNRTVSRRTARSTVRKKTGNYLKSISASRAWRNSQGGYGVYIYTSRPPGFHAHLIEYGHEVYIRGKPTGKQTRAFRIMERGNQLFRSTFWGDTEKFIHKLVDNGLKGR